MTFVLGSIKVCVCVCAICNMWDKIDFTEIFLKIVEKEIQEEGEEEGEKVVDDVEGNFFNQ